MRKSVLTLYENPFISDNSGVSAGAMPSNFELSMLIVKLGTSSAVTGFSGNIPLNLFLSILPEKAGISSGISTSGSFMKSFGSLTVVSSVSVFMLSI